MSNLLKFLKLAFGMLSSFVWVMQLLKVFLFLLRGFHWVFLDRAPPPPPPAQGHPSNRDYHKSLCSLVPWFERCIQAHCCDISRSLRILIGWHSKATSSKQGYKPTLVK